MHTTLMDRDLNTRRKDSSKSACLRLTGCKIANSCYFIATWSLLFVQNVDVSRAQRSFSLVTHTEQRAKV